MNRVPGVRQLVLSSLLFCAITPAFGDEARGLWLRDEGAARVKIVPCGTALCGTIVWLRDRNGPAQVGQRVFFDMKASGPNTWAGTAFNPEDGRNYSGRMEVSGRSMVTTGCALGGLICKAVSWSRID